MYDKDRAVIIDQEANLDRPAAAATADYVEAVVTDCPRRPRISHDGFDFFDRDAMFRGVIEVPGNPSKNGAACHHFIME
jgi:hypothetical protein